MATTSASSRPLRVPRPLWYLGAFFLSGLGISAVYAVTGLGIPCPFRALTGWECPLCGSTRMGAALLRLDPAAAVAYNSLVLVGLVVLAGWGAVCTVAVIRGRTARLPISLLHLLSQLSRTRWLVLALTGLAAFTVLRNLL